MTEKTKHGTTYIKCDCCGEVMIIAGTDKRKVNESVQKNGWRTFHVRKENAWKHACADCVKAGRHNSFFHKTEKPEAKKPLTWDEVKASLPTAIEITPPMPIHDSDSCVVVIAKVEQIEKLLQNLNIVKIEATKEEPKEEKKDGLPVFVGYSNPNDPAQGVRDLSAFCSRLGVEYCRYTETGRITGKRMSAANSQFGFGRFFSIKNKIFGMKQLKHYRRGKKYQNNTGNTIGA